ncbi:MAG: dihydroorotase [Candidatus Omnitrophica bacterium]|nr:dihydroorotase [Candidatus Omnitrophota bacterium]
MKAPRILIKGGRLIDPAEGVDEVCDLLIEGGKVAARGKGLKAEGAQGLDAKGKVVAPGFIDLHVHLRFPGQEQKETLITGSKAAIKGGFTTICTMANTDPVIDSGAVIESVKAQTGKLGWIRILPYAAVTMGLKGETLTEMGELRAAVAVGFSDDGMPILNAGLMRRALEYTRLAGPPVIAHCEEKSLTGAGVMHDGVTATRLGLAGMPAEAETVMIARDLLLAEGTRGRLHIAHVSTGAGVELIRAAKGRGVQVTAEVTPHHLTLTDEALNTYESRFKMNPPLRTEADLEALRNGLRDGTLDAVATDHAPHSRAEKELDLGAAPFGVVGLETAAAVLLTELVNRGTVPLPVLIASLTARPAQVLGIDRGRLSKGSAADVTILDLEADWIVEAGSFASKGVNSPFLGWRLKGQVTDVLVAGEPVLRNGQFLVNGESA